MSGVFDVSIPLEGLGGTLTTQEWSPRIRKVCRRLMHASNAQGYTFGMSLAPPPLEMTIGVA